MKHNLTVIILTLLSVLLIASLTAGRGAPISEQRLVLDASLQDGDRIVWLDAAGKVKADIWGVQSGFEGVDLHSIASGSVDITAADYITLNAPEIVMTGHVTQEDAR